MTISRLTGWIVFLAGLSLLIGDVAVWFETGVWAPVAFGEFWRQLDLPSLNLAQSAIQGHLSAALWDGVIVSLLLCWASAVLIAIGAAILLSSARKRKRRP